MVKAGVALMSLALSATIAWSLPIVDGQVTNDEYAKSTEVLDGSATLYYQADGDGGLYLAVVAATEGWVGLGLGSGVMSGAHIYMGYVKDGAPVFSEQVGDGHSHGESAKESYDSSAVGQEGGMTTIEFHLPAGELPVADSKLDFVVAFSGSQDLTTYHEDNREGGSIDLSSP